MDSEHKWEARSNPLLNGTILCPDRFPQVKARWMFRCRECGIVTWTPWEEDPHCEWCLRIIEPDNMEIRNDCDCRVCVEDRGPVEYETCARCGGDVDEDYHCTDCHLWLWHPASRVPHYA